MRRERLSTKFGIPRFKLARGIVNNEHAAAWLQPRGCRLSAIALLRNSCYQYCGGSETRVSGLCIGVWVSVRVRVPRPLLITF